MIAKVIEEGKKVVILFESTVISKGLILWKLKI